MITSKIIHKLMMIYPRALISMAALFLAHPPPSTLAFGCRGFHRRFVGGGCASLSLSTRATTTSLSSGGTLSSLPCSASSPSSSSIPYLSKPSSPSALHLRPFVSSRTLSAIRGGSQQHSRRSTSVYNSASTTRSSADELEGIISLPASFEQRKEDVSAALLSVFAACQATRHVQPTGDRKGIKTLSKRDASPVTVGDFASQALALDVLHKYFPKDMFIAEEGSDALREDEELLKKVLLAANHANEGLLDKEQLLRAIDYGQGVINGIESSQQSTGEPGTRRVWCLDPIDGTKGFLRGRMEGGQYCIALALLEDGEPVLSILGCPNLPLQSTPATTTDPYGLWSEEEIEEAEKQQQSMFSNRRGCLFVAVRGCGCYEIPLHVIETNLINGVETESSEATDTINYWRKLQVTPNDGSYKPTSEAKFCLGVERGFSDPKGTVLKIAQRIHGSDALTTDSDGIQDIKNSLRLDGQGKYGLLARGDAECFLRLPKDGYVDWVWDVAAGYLILKEAGGTMTDVHGNPIDFSEIGIERRAKLPDHVEGIFGSSGGVFHEALVNAYANVEQK